MGLGFVEMVGAGAMLNADGLLPPGRIRVTVDQVKVMFVDAFPDSATRPTLYQAWVRHRQAVEAVVPIVAQWVNGSYVTSKVDPGDVDVVTLIDQDLADALDPGSIAILGSLMDGSNTRNVWGVDSYVIPVVEDGHPMSYRLSAAAGILGPPVESRTRAAGPKRSVSPSASRWTTASRPWWI